MKNYQLRSALPCLVKWQGGEEFLEDGLVLNFNQPTRLFIYPASGRREDVAFVLNMSLPSERVKVFHVEEETIFFLDENSSSSIAVKETISVGDKNIEFELDGDSVKIVNADKICSAHILKPKTYRLQSHENFAILKIKATSLEEAIVFNSETNSITCIEAEKIEIVGGEIICEKQGREEKYIIADGTLSKIKSIENFSRNSKILGLSFLQMVKNKQYSAACNLLSENLHASEDKIAAYFGEIKNILPLNEKEFLIAKKSGHYITRLEQREDKIVGIEMKD